MAPLDGSAGPPCLLAPVRGDQLTRGGIHNAFTLADGRDARLRVSIGTKILLRGESPTADTRIHGHRGKVTESVLSTDASGGADRARAWDRHDRLTGTPGREQG